MVFGQDLGKVKSLVESSQNTSIEKRISHYYN